MEIPYGIADFRRHSVSWRICLRSSPERVYELLATAEGRERFWAEAAPERDGSIHFLFPSGERLEAEIVERMPHHRFSLRYFASSLVEFSITQRPRGGTILALRESGLSSEGCRENNPGWVSVLLNLKAEPPRVENWRGGEHRDFIFHQNEIVVTPAVDFTRLEEVIVVAPAEEPRPPLHQQAALGGVP